ncbi:MAG: creatininase family protein, partial [Acidimicrobiia bacterium]|nr:creatininase family protein [Acidimicrobiia bacterium]
MTWPEIESRARRPVLIVPLGSCEQHGPHLPLHTDTVIATALAERLAKTDDSFLVAPAVAAGASGEHQAFPGTLSIGTAAMTQVVVELVR